MSLGLFLLTAVGSKDFLSLGAGLLRWLFSVLCQLGVDCIILVLAVVVAMIELNLLGLRSERFRCAEIRSSSFVSRLRGIW